MTDAFKEESFEEKLAILESEMKAALQATGRKKSWVVGYQWSYFKPQKWSLTNMENKTVAYRQ